MQSLDESRAQGGPLPVSLAAIRPVLGLAAGLPPEHAEVLAVVRAAARASDGAHISLADYFRLLKALSQAAGQETFALSNRPLLAGTVEFVFTKAEQSATVGEAMREIARAYNLLHGDAYNRVEFRGGAVVYELDDEHFPYARPRDQFLHFSLECTLLFLHGALCELADEALTRRVRRIQTRRPAAITGDGAALAFWTAPVARGAGVYSIAYDRAVASLPLRRRIRRLPLDLAIHNRILSLVEARETGVEPHGNVEAAVFRALQDGLKDQGEIAARLGVSVATLRRKLSGAGASFRALHHSVLKQKACTRLAENGSVAETAEALGFSDPRSFSRAFKALMGETPSAFIDRARSQPA
jgi:AraC-like DNA-binding protein